MPSGPDSAQRAAPRSSVLAASDLPLRALLPRAAIGGVLMGLANLVPGISGGTMLLAAGVYPAFVTAIAELSTLRVRTRAVVTVGAIGASAALAILLLAGPMKTLVVEQRWLMYSLFIGLTLGGVPLVWRLARPPTPAVWMGAAGAFAAMVAMLWVPADSAGGAGSTTLLFVSGLAGASAMILPGVSGGYLLLLLGQYETILGAVDRVKQALLGPAGPDFALLLGAMQVVLPVGLGVVAGIVGVSNLLSWLMARYEKAVLGALLGLLFGAVVGLWPFQQPVPPAIGDIVDGRVVTAANLGAVEVEDWRLVRFTPGPLQAAASLGAVALGFAATLAISRIGARDDDPPTAGSA